MFASQLLRILQTLPADAKYEPRVIDEDDLKVRVTDKYYKETDSLSFNTKESLHSKDHGKVADPLLNAHELEHSKVVDDSIINANSGIRVSSVKDDPSEDLYHLNRVEKDEGALTSDEEEIDGLWNTPELECSLIMDECSSPNKTVLEYELPELMVCYKEINYHVVKDIGVDNGVPVADKVSFDENSKIPVGTPISFPSKEHATNGTPGGLDFELLIHNESKASPKLDAEKHRYKEENGLMNSVIIESKRVSEEEDKKEKNATGKKEKDGLFEESIITSSLPLKKFGTRSFLRSFMDSFDDNHGDIVVQHLNQNMKPSLQILDVESEAEDSDQDTTETKLIYNSKVENGIITFDFSSSEPTTADKGMNHNDPNSNNDLATLVVQHTEIETKHQESVLDHGFSNSSNPFILDELHQPVIDGSSVNIHQETLLNNKGHPNNPFVVEVQSNTTNVSTAEASPTTLPNQKKDVFNLFSFSVTETDNIEPAKSVEENNSNNPFVVSNHQHPELGSEVAQTSNPFSSSRVQSAIIQGNIEKSDQHPEVKNKKENSNNLFAKSETGSAEIARTSPNVNTEILHGESFEASFSAVSGRIPDSGAITSSGSTSVRSDSSSTSMRSFAFPVRLQCEWNDSPEKFGKAKKGDFQKQRGRWKQGAWRALCCSGRLTG